MYRRIALRMSILVTGNVIFQCNGRPKLVRSLCFDKDKISDLIDF